MLLTCCFRKNKEEKRKRTRPDGGSNTSDHGRIEVLKERYQAVPVGDKRSSLSTISNETNVEVHLLSHDSRDLTSRPPFRDGKDRLNPKARAPLQKEAKRLMKRQSQESIRQAEVPTISSSIPYIDQSPPKDQGSSAIAAISGNETNYLRRYQTPASISSTAASSTNYQPSQQNSTKRWGNGAKSTPNLPTTTPVHTNGVYQSSNNVKESPYRSPAAPNPPPLSMRSCHQHKTSFSSGNTSSSPSPLHLYGNYLTSNLGEERMQTRGITRSNASYGIQQMLQDQIIKEDQEQRRRYDLTATADKYEERISAMKAEHNLVIQKMLREKTTELNNARNNFQTELKLQQEKAMGMLTEMKSKQEENMIKLRDEFQRQMEESQNNNAKIIKEYEERDQSWQIEKQDVLSEIQRLKEEANRFIAILSQENEDDDSLSPSKKQSLTKEVESLQLVVEMRTSELHRLREEREKHIRQLDEYETLKVSMDKMSSRVEDLQAQLDAKTKMERQLSLEKSNLVNSYELESKNKARMSMQVEELQWRIKNNFELPAPQVFSPEKEVKKFPDATTPNNNSNPVVLDNSPARKFQKSPTKEQIILESRNANAKSRPVDLPSLVADTLPDPPKAESNEDHMIAVVDEKEVHHSDEGISSEASNSPQPPEKETDPDHEEEMIPVVENNNHRDNGYDNNSNSIGIINSSPVKISAGSPSKSSPCDERVPSRIPLSVAANGKGKN